MSDLLDALMCEVLAKMSVISEQQGRSYDGITVHGGEKATVRPLSEKPLVDYFRDRYSTAHSLRARREVVIAAVEALRIARRMPIPAGQEPEYGSPQWKHYIAVSTEDAGALATRFFCTRRYINAVRKATREGGLMPPEETRRAA